MCRSARLEVGQLALMNTNQPIPRLQQLLAISQCTSAASVPLAHVPPELHQHTRLHVCRNSVAARAILVVSAGGAHCARAVAAAGDQAG